MHTNTLENRTRELDSTLRSYIESKCINEQMKKKKKKLEFILSYITYLTRSRCKVD